MHSVWFYIGIAFIYPATIYFFFGRLLTLRISRPAFLMICILQQECKVGLMAYSVLVKTLPYLNILTIADDFLLLFLVLMLFQEDLPEKMFVFCMVMFLQTIPALPIVYFSSKLLDRTSVPLYSILILCLWAVIYYIFIVLLIAVIGRFQKSFCSMKYKNRRTLATALMMVYYLIEAAGLFTTIDALMSVPREAEFWHIGVMFLIAMLGAAVFYVFLSHMEDARLSRELEIIREQKNLEYKTMQIQERNLDALRKLKHDQQNHLLTIRMLLERNETKTAAEYVGGLIGTNERTAARFSANKVADAVLADASLRCEGENIRFSVEETLPEKIGIAPEELSSLLFNILDNAINAAAGNADGEAWVTCRLSEVSGQFLGRCGKRRTRDGKP
jgi:signal transduction histidine kinase